MRTINIAELKNTLSEQLRRVRKGESLLIADRNQIVARLEPASEHEADDDDRLSVLEAKGILRRGTGPLTVSSLLDRPRVDVDILAALLAERDDGR